ncbi:hypothetical protein [Chryseobacterium sp. SIMBA_029]|uniref:hypothetical protein n=1 Tax=Chryseobacterium sp. SIMBA_029 TaxID=3085772 RepID=UPI00397E4B1D
MKNKILTILAITFYSFAFGQVGINENSPSATLDIKSKGNTATTKALEINNSNGTEMVTVLDNGNVGINVPTPTAKLHTNGTVRYENLPVLLAGISLGIDANGYLGTYIPTPLFSYLTINDTQATSTFSLDSATEFYSLPFIAAGILSNSLGVSLGTDATATLGGTAATNVIYFTIPNPGVYKINLGYYTSCTGAPSASVGGANFLGIGTGIYLAASGSTTYSLQTNIRNNTFPLRNTAGDLITNQYSFPSPANIFSIIETTSANQKVALTVSWGTADQYSSTAACSLAVPSGLDKKVTLTVSKL